MMSPIWLWCEDFNITGKQLTPPAYLQKEQGRYIETWVNNIELIAAEKLLLGNSGIHRKLNKVIATLTFGRN